MRTVLNWIAIVPICLCNFLLVHPLTKLLSNEGDDELKTYLRSCSLRNQVAIVTGSNTGIGERTAASLSKLGATVILACRSSSRGKEAELKLMRELESCNRDEYPLADEGSVQFIPLDLSSVTSVVSFARILKKNYRHVDILVNNAGLAYPGKTSLGIQEIFQVNFLGHFLLLKCLRSLLSACDDGTPAGRVVNLSSVTHHLGSVDFRNAATTDNNCYADTKLYMNYLTFEINRRYGLGALNSNPKFVINAVSANPGAVRSDIWRFVPQPIKFLFDLLMRMLFLNVEQGCASSVMGAIMPSGKIQDYFHAHKANEKRTKAGLYFHPYLPYLVPYHVKLAPFSKQCEVMGPFTSPKFSKSTNKHDIQFLCKDLWEFSSELCLKLLKEAWKDAPEKLENIDDLLRDD